MKKVKSRRHVVTGAITAILALLCLVLFPVTGFTVRFLISAVILLAWSAVNLSIAFTKKGILEELAGCADERDRYLAMRTSHRALQLLNHILCGACFVSLVLYGALRLSGCLVVAATLCGVLVLLFLLTLCVNVWEERRG